MCVPFIQESKEFLGRWLEALEPLGAQSGIAKTPLYTLTQGNSRLSERSPSEFPVLMVSQKPEALNQTNELTAMTYAN